MSLFCAPEKVHAVDRHSPLHRSLAHPREVEGTRSEAWQEEHGRLGWSWSDRLVHLKASLTTLGCERSGLDSFFFNTSRRGSHRVMHVVFAKTKELGDGRERAAAPRSKRRARRQETSPILEEAKAKKRLKSPHFRNFPIAKRKKFWIFLKM